MGLFLLHALVTLSSASASDVLGQNRLFFSAETRLKHRESATIETVPATEFNSREADGVFKSSVNPDFASTTPQKTRSTSTMSGPAHSLSHSRSDVAAAYLPADTNPAIVFSAVISSSSSTQVLINGMPCQSLTGVSVHKLLVQCKHLGPRFNLVLDSLTGILQVSQNGLNSGRLRPGDTAVFP